MKRLQWTERGLGSDLLKKTLSVPESRAPRLIRPGRVEKGGFSAEGYPLYSYQTLILEDFYRRWKISDRLDEATKERIDKAYQEMKDHVGFELGLQLFSCQSTLPE